MPFRLHLFHKHNHDWMRSSELESAAAPLNPAANFPQHHVRCRQIGVGGEANVETWSYGRTGTIVAVKILQPKAKKTFPIEVEILKTLPAHPSIVHCFAFVRKAPSPNVDSIIFEYCASGDLWGVNRRMREVKKADFSESFMWSVFTQLCSAVAFLHEGIGVAKPADADFWRPIVHRDIKLENLFVVTLGKKEDWSSIVIKLGDFGLSAFYDPSNERMPGMFGTCILWPPEQTWENRKATPAGDIWATGCVIHELAHGFPPAENPDRMEQAWRGPPPFPARWDTVVKKSYWAAKTPRKAIPINLESEHHAKDARRIRPTPKYSDGLNECMMMALQAQVGDRPAAGLLKENVEEGHASFLFEALRIENEALEREMKDDNSEGEWQLTRGRSEDSANVKWCRRMRQFLSPEDSGHEHRALQEVGSCGSASRK